MAEAEAVPQVAVAPNLCPDGDGVLQDPQGHQQQIQRQSAEKEAEEKSADFPKGDPFCGGCQQKA